LQLYFIGKSSLNDFQTFFLNYVSEEIMINRILNYNKKNYLRYNRFRKRVFSELAPKDSEAVLYMLPWLLSINHFACPGYLPDLKIPFRVFNIDNEPEIVKREPLFKRLFGITRQGPLLKPSKKHLWIEGLYSIGSVGTITQTQDSDCDIWVCYDKNQFNKTAWKQLNQKLNLIKDWLDIHYKMPVYFFISDVGDIRESRFGSVDTESCGSTQKNVLKEEFYRTCILICGKIPLWWLCYNDKVILDYNDALSAIRRKSYDGYDLIDFGNLERIENDEYFGAVLWQLHKSISKPLKSIVKMILLEILLKAPPDRLMCHEYRKQVLSTHDDSLYPDPLVVTIVSIFEYYQTHRKSTLNFLKQCVYLRCKIKTNDKRTTLKDRIADDLFSRYPLDENTRKNLSDFTSWDLDSQINLGNKIFRLLIRIYKEISGTHSDRDVTNAIDQQDLTIIGRKLSAVYQKKKNKITILHKPTGSLNLTSIFLSLEDTGWYAFSGNDGTNALFSNPDIIHIIAFIVWNNLYSSSRLHMKPNPSSVTLQEIINLGKQIRDIFGTYDNTHIEYANFLKREYIIKILVIVSFENSPWDKDINDFAVVYLNNWGELFVKRFNSPVKLDNFLNKNCHGTHMASISFYLQRNCSSYEKIIQRTKNILLDSLNVMKS